jgi:microcystin-dependent protein
LYELAGRSPYQDATLPKPWLFCNGSTVLRAQYERLFAVIGDIYGPGDGKYTFNLPDLRGRVPVGVDMVQANVAGINKLGLVGGQTTHWLTVEQLPPHKHSTGSLSTSSSGSNSHSIDDQGHDHGGRTGSKGLRKGKWGMSSGGQGNDHTSHSHTIPRGTTGIRINSDGVHSHTVAYGETGSNGLGEQFSLMQPYQTFNYIIYAA